MPFASVYADAVDMIEGSTKQPWRKHKCGRWAMIVGDDVLLHNM
jgi:hypothetical protein